MRERVLTERHVHILIITINRPEAKNAFDLASAQSMHRAMDLDAEDDHFVAVITALPPAVCAAVTAAIRHLKSSQWERDRHQERAARVKSVLYGAGFPVMLTEDAPRACHGGRSGEVQGSERSPARRVRHLCPADQLSDRASQDRAAAHHAVAIP